MKKRVVINASETHIPRMCCKSRIKRLSDKRTARHNDPQRQQEEKNDFIQED